MKNTQYINIQGWMINELQLKGNDLIVYAIIYGFSQDGESEFNGSLSYLIEATNSSRATMIRSLKLLCQKNLIFKIGVSEKKQTNCYIVNHQVVSNRTKSGSKMKPASGTKMTPNNNTSNTIGNNGEIPLDIQPIKKVKKKFIPPTESEVIIYFGENKYSVEAAKKAFKYYDVADWKDAKGNQVKNWKQKMISVWFRSENLATSGNSFDIEQYK